MIGIAGIARSGKDSQPKELKKLIEKDHDVDVKIIHLADRLKSDLINSYLVTLILMF